MLPQPAINEQKQFWDWHWQHWKERGTINEWKDRRHETALAFLCSLSLTHPKILDLGCGPGWYTRNLAKYGEVTGLDLSGEAIDVAKSRYPHIKFFCGNLYDFPLGLNQYDVVVSQEVFDHVEDQGAFLDKVAKFLKPRGYLILSCANKVAMDRLRNGAFPIQPAGHIAKYLDIKNVRHLLNSHFKVLRMRPIIPISHLMKPDGFVRVINSYKLNRLVGLLVSQERLDALKLWLGFGYQIIVLARKR